MAEVHTKQKKKRGDPSWGKKDKTTKGVPSSNETDGGGTQQKKHGDPS